MEEQETREERYLRVLTSGPRGVEDYDVVRYLKERGYTDSQIRISYMRSTFNQVVDVIWLGPNAKGLDYIEELRAFIAKAQTKQIDNGQAEKAATRPDGKKEPNVPIDLVPVRRDPVDKRAWDEKPLGKIWIGLIILALGLLVSYLFKTHFGISS